ncbi:MAG: hypothetical protein R3F62_02625 [Planctomycetota bacterium]
MDDPTPPVDPTPPPAAQEPAWTPVRPIKRPSQTFSGGPQRTLGPDAVAESQVRGLALVFYALALLQLVLAVFLGALSPGNDPAPGFQAPLLLPFVFLGVALAVKLVEAQQTRFLAAIVLALPMLIVLWSNGSSGMRLTASTAANAAVFVGLGSGIWDYKNSARLIAAGWAVYLLALPWLVFPSSMRTENLYLAILPAIVLATLFVPRTGQVFDDRYSPAERSDPNGVNPLQSIALWGFVVWFAYPLIRLLSLFFAWL